MPIRVVLLDDDDRFRARLAERLSYFEGIKVVGQSDSVEGLFSTVSSLDVLPNVALLDVELRGLTGIDAARRLSQEYPSVEALMLTVFEQPEKIFEAIQSGASGYLLKDAEAGEIVRAIREVHDGGAPLSRSVARRVLGLLKEPSGPVVRESLVHQGPPPVEKSDGPAEQSEGQAVPLLSAREVELLRKIVDGDTEASIAKELFISPHTVRTHVKNIYRKLQVSSRAAAVRVTFERGLLQD